MARQRMVHGALIDTATPDEIEQIIGAALERHDILGYFRKRGVINLDASGNGSTGPQDGLKVSSQFDWFMERIMIGGNTRAANALVVMFENSSASDADMIEVIQLGTAGRYSDSFSNDSYISANSQLVITVQAGPANGQVTYNLQIRLESHKSVGD